MQSLMFILEIMGAYFVVSCALGIYQLLFGNRTGNSGRYKHWTEEDE